MGANIASDKTAENPPESCILPPQNCIPQSFCTEHFTRRTTDHPRIYRADPNQHIRTHGPPPDFWIHRIPDTHEPHSELSPTPPRYNQTLSVYITQNYSDRLMDRSVDCLNIPVLCMKIKIYDSHRNHVPVQPKLVMDTTSSSKVADRAAKSEIQKG